VLGDACRLRVFVSQCCLLPKDLHCIQISRIARDFSSTRTFSVLRYQRYKPGGHWARRSPLFVAVNPFHVFKLSRIFPHSASGRLTLTQGALAVYPRPPQPPPSACYWRPDTFPLLLQPEAIEPWAIGRGRDSGTTFLRCALGSVAGGNPSGNATVSV